MIFLEGLASYIEALHQSLIFLIWVCALMVPLGIWKFVEILIWLVHHVHWG